MQPSIKTLLISSKLETDFKSEGFSKGQLKYEPQGGDDGDDHHHHYYFGFLFDIFFKQKTKSIKFD